MPWENIKLSDYSVTMWHIDYLDKDLEYQLTTNKIINGSILDIGCGHGTQSNLLSNLGFDVTGIDVNEHMLNYAKSINPIVKYIHGNFLEYTFDCKFDYTFDRGCLHLFKNEKKSNFIHKVHSLTNNLFFTKVAQFSQFHNRTPKPISKEDFTKLLSEKFKILDLIPGKFSEKVTKEQLIFNQKHTPQNSLFAVCEPL